MTKTITISNNTIVIRIKFKKPQELNDFSSSKEFGNSISQLITKTSEYEAKLTSEVY